MWRTYKQNTLLGKIILVPFIDFLFCLLFSYMLLATFTKEETKEIPVSLPFATTGKVAKSFNIWINKKGVIYFNQKKISTENLGIIINKFFQDNNLTKEKVLVSLGADRDVALKQVVKVLEVLQKNNIYNISLKTTSNFYND